MQIIRLLSFRGVNNIHQQEAAKEVSQGVVTLQPSNPPKLFLASVAQ